MLHEMKGHRCVFGVDTQGHISLGAEPQSITILTQENTQMIWVDVGMDNGKECEQGHLQIL